MSRCSIVAATLVLGVLAGGAWARHYGPPGPPVGRGWGPPPPIWRLGPPIGVGFPFPPPVHHRHWRPIAFPLLPLPTVAMVPPAPAIAMAAPARPPMVLARPPVIVENPKQGEKLATLGQRLFRAGNLPRSAERFRQAAQANPKAAAPWVGVAQVAIARGRYSEAATALRRANSAEPGWLLNAQDVQAMYAEPGDFHKQIARLETHLQLHPNDRDAWLVLGAELYLSGRTRRAADIFLRLSDRAPDATLAAFLEASQANGNQAQ